MNNGLKIFYAIQATGNGHIARAMELLPYLQQYGNVDVFLSGSNSNLEAALPIKYRSKGISLFYGNKGGLDYWKMWKELNISRIYKEAKALPIEKYDVVINDFDSITSMACKLKNIPSVNFGHQASFQSNKTPRPTRKDVMGELVLKHYATAESYIGVHFKEYDDFIFSPIIKDDILKADVTDKGHISVYLSHYSDAVVQQSLQVCKDIKFEIFSKTKKQVETVNNITFIPINNKAFNESMLSSHGVITGAGFETPAEALYMGKKLLCLPIRGQYEQLCNAAALQDFNVPILDKLTPNFNQQIENWLANTTQQRLTLNHSTYDIVQQVIEKARSLRPAKSSNNAWLNEEDFLVMG
ncbi:MAG: glycosyl transferase [Pedobacter sp.]|nr:glycosyl transferase [Chitinophagaceae bacterium]